MTKNDVLLVLPKLSAYALKSDVEKDNIRSIVKEYVKFIRDMGRHVNCFAQDFLAVELLSGEDVTWISVVGTADLLFSQESLADVPEVYKRLEVTTVDAEIIKEAIAKHKLRRPTAREDMDAYAQERAAIVQRRIRYACNKIIETCRVLTIYVNANNNFCNEPEHEPGDGICMLVKDVASGLERCYYSGLTMDTETFKSIV